MNQKQKLGRLGETFAEQVLSLDGYRIIERNYRCKDGEIDLIAERDDELYFIEVKTRRSQLFGRPSESVNYKKQQHLRKAARNYLAESKNYHQYYSFQVIEICIEQIKQAF